MGFLNSINFRYVGLCVLVPLWQFESVGGLIFK